MENKIKKPGLLEDFRNKMSEYRRLRIKKCIEAHNKSIELSKNAENLFFLKQNNN